MKRILSVVLLSCLLVSFVFSATGCGLFAKKIGGGTEAAKLLLANERMDEKLVGQKIDVGFSKAERLLSAKSVSVEDAIMQSASYTWSNFPSYSTSMVEFEQFMKGVEDYIGRVAEDIIDMKKKVGITDKWVDAGNYRQLLRVYNNRDVLFEIDGSGNFFVYNRYTDSNAKNVYETYAFMSDAGSTGQIRMMLIPGERYEYMYQHSSGFNDYFIAENTRGYWMSTRFDYTEADGEQYSNLFSYIVKDGLGCGTHMMMRSPTMLEPTNGWYTVFDPAGERELFRVEAQENFYKYDLYFTAIRDGFVSASAAEALKEEAGIYTTATIDTLTTEKGVYHVQNELPENAFGFAGGYVQYIYGENMYYGSLSFNMKSPKMSFGEATAAFGAYAESLGLSLYCDMETVARSLDHAAILSDGFGQSFEWNGYKINHIDNLGKAVGVLKSQFADAKAAYEEIRNNPFSQDRQRLSSDAHFAELGIAVAGDNRFDGNTVSLSGLAVSTSDVALFEQGKEYVLEVGIALLDASGNPMSANTVALSGGTSAKVAFEGGSITLGAEGKYAIPLNLDRGEYAVVVYAVTKDEGIRVSEMVKIGFASIAEGEIESSAMHIEAADKNDNLILTYEIKNIRRISVVATKASYSYAEIKRMITLEILAYGAPSYGAVLEYENGGAVDESAVLGKGTYRMVCYLATGDGLAQSYIYLSIV